MTRRRALLFHYYSGVMRISPIGLLVCLSAALLTGCEELPAPDPDPDPTPDDGACVVPGQSEIQEVEFEGSIPECPWAWECGVDEYLELPHRYPDLIVETTDEALDQMLTQVSEGGIPQEPDPGIEVIRDRILSATRLDAHVEGLASGYWSFSNDPDNSYLLDENVPDLWHLAQVINTFEHGHIPVLEVPYGYPDGMDDLLDFFDDTIL